MTTLPPSPFCDKPPRRKVKVQWFIQENDTWVIHAMNDETGEGWSSKAAATRVLKALGWKNCKVVS